MAFGEDTSPEIEHVATAVVDAAYKVHRELGPGLLESVYLTCLEHELKKRGFAVEREFEVPVIYDGVTIDVGFRVDLLVDRLVVVELKAVVEMHPVFKAQILTHLKLLHLRLGLLINFNVLYIKDGLQRVLNRADLHT
jgi:GxxExxY protein